MSADYKIPKHKLLTRQEETQLFQLYHTTDSHELKLQIKNKIVNHNLLFASGAASTYAAKYSHVDPNDLKGYAMMGLIEAVDRFDHTRGLKFISFAVWWIKNSITKGVQNFESLVRYPGNLHCDLQSRMTNKELTDEDMLMLEAIRGGISMSMPLDSGCSNHNVNTVEDILQSEESDETISDRIDTSIISNTIHEILNELDCRQRRIIEELFGLKTGEPRTIRDIATELNISHENVRYIRDRALTKLRTKVTCLG